MADDALTIDLSSLPEPSRTVLLDAVQAAAGGGDVWVTLRGDRVGRLVAFSEPEQAGLTPLFGGQS